MIERVAYPAGVPCWLDTAQPDPEAAARFYGGLFGWEFEDRMPAGVSGSYLVASLEGLDVAAVGSAPAGAPPTPAWTTYVRVDSADASAATAADAGGLVVAEPFDIPGAGRMAVLADPSGAAFCTWEPKGHIGAQLVNAPGAWSWSTLNTRDLAGATAFYGRLFGWEVGTVTAAGQELALARLAGYGEHLAERDPELPARLAEYDAPEGFGDAVAWMAPMTPDQFPEDVPPHWSVMFSVDDVDATAETAARLGGEVTVPPFDVPTVRMAVLTDPQGAAFTVARYDPGSEAS